MQLTIKINSEKQGYTRSSLRFFLGYFVTGIPALNKHLTDRSGYLL